MWALKATPSRFVFQHSAASDTWLCSAGHCFLRLIEACGVRVEEAPAKAEKP
jgi:hypothetical protein